MKKEQYTLNRCPACVLVFLHPQPEAEFLKEEVYSYKSGYQSGKSHDLSEMVPNKHQQKVIDFFRTQEPGTVLDVGCSVGMMMHFLQEEGFQPEGVELNARTAAIAEENGFKVFKDFLEKAPYPPQSFDYVFLGDIIEHVNNPRTFLQNCRKFLKKTGKIVVVTPNLDCFWSKSTLWLWKLFRIPWSSVTPPHHLFQFSTDNLINLMRQEGIEPVKVWYNPPPRLTYELGSLHLLRAFKKQKSPVRLVGLVIGLALYTIFYGFYEISRLFFTKDNGIALVGVLPRADA